MQIFSTKTAVFCAIALFICVATGQPCDQCDSQRGACCHSGSWGEIEFLLMGNRGGDFPPLVTTSPIGTDADNAGELGLSTTTVLFGGNDLGEGPRPGARISFGQWMDCRECWAVEGRFWALLDQSNDFRIDSSDNPIIARPILNVTDNQGVEPDAFLIAHPDEATGRIRVDSDSEVLTSDITIRHLLARGCRSRVDFVVGYQFGRIQEDLTIASSLTAVPGAALRTTGTTVDLSDSFEASNEFHGGQIGLLVAYDYCCYSVKGVARLGLGNMHQRVAIAGGRVTDDGATVSSDAQGLLTQSTNIGVYEQDRFSVAPEIGVKCAYRRGPCFELTLGYSWLLWTEVLRIGDQVDPDLAVNLAANPTGQMRPLVPLDGSTYWVHGLSAGMRLRW